MFEKVGDMMKMMKEAGKLQEEMKKHQEALGARSFEAAAGGGAVTVTVNGRLEILKVVFDHELATELGLEALAALVVGATNEALKKAKEGAQGDMMSLLRSTGINLPTE